MSLEVLDSLIVVEVSVDFMLLLDVMEIVDKIVDTEDIEDVLVESLAVVLLVI
jgi:hypothetical protein